MEKTIVKFLGLPGHVASSLEALALSDSNRREGAPDDPNQRMRKQVVVSVSDLHGIKTKGVSEESQPAVPLRDLSLTIEHGKKSGNERLEHLLPFLVASGRFHRPEEDGRPVIVIQSSVIEVWRAVTDLVETQVYNLSRFDPTLSFEVLAMHGPTADEDSDEPEEFTYISEIEIVGTLAVQAAQFIDQMLQDHADAWEEGTVVYGWEHKMRRLSGVAGQVPRATRAVHVTSSVGAHAQELEVALLAMLENAMVLFGEHVVFRPIKNSVPVGGAGGFLNSLIIEVTANEVFLEVLESMWTNLLRCSKKQFRFSCRFGTGEEGKWESWILRESDDNREGGAGSGV